MAAPAGRVRVRTVLRVPEFRALWVAEAQSLLGDQLARVALVVLAYRQTGSPAVSGVIYALTFLPAVVGGAALSGLADRFARRTLMIWCDVIRAGLLAAMALPHLPLAVVGCLLVAAVLVGRPFTAAQLALLPDVLPGESYVVGSGVRMMTDQVGQLAGFAVGGVVVAAIGSRPALLVDAATFLVSASILRLFVEHRPPVRSPRAGEAGRGGRVRAALGAALGDRRRRTLLGLGCLAAFHVVPEGIAPAYASSLGAGPAAVGVLMAALPLGTAFGAGLLVRMPATLRSRLLVPLPLAAAVPLAACALKPGLAVSLGLWALCGLFAGYQVVAGAAFVASVPDSRRGQAVGVASSAVVAAQGAGVAGFGAVADYLGSAHAVALAGAAGFVLALPLVVSWARANGSVPPVSSPVSSAGSSVGSSNGSSTGSSIGSHRQATPRRSRHGR